MKKIESRQNPLFKQALKLSHDTRSNPDLIIVEGAKLISEAIEAGAVAQTLFLTAGTKLPEFDVNCIELPTALFKELSTVTSPADAICIFSQKEPQPLAKLCQKAKMLVVLDRLQDPGNIGTIIRTSEAMGADAVILLSGCCSSNNTKVIRAAMGSSFRLPVYNRIEAQELFQLLTKHLFTCICTDMQGQSVHSFSFPEKSALFLGQEGSGTAEKVEKECAMKLAIPMQGRVESLNVATSAAICLYEWSKQQAHRPEKS